MSIPDIPLPLPLTTLEDPLFDSNLEKVSLMHITEASKYATEIFKSNASNLEFCKKQISGKHIYSTSIGDVAYMGLYSCPEYRQIYKDLFYNISLHHSTLHYN